MTTTRRGFLTKLAAIVAVGPFVKLGAQPMASLEGHPIRKYQLPIDTQWQGPDLTVRPDVGDHLVALDYMAAYSAVAVSIDGGAYKAVESEGRIVVERPRFSEAAAGKFVTFRASMNGQQEYQMRVIPPRA